MKKMKVAMVLNDLNINGISTVVSNYCNHINLDRFTVNVLAGEPVSEVYKENYKSLGIDVKNLPSRKKSAKAYYKALFKALKEGKYDIIHVHGNSATITPELMLAKLSGIKVRIAHSHNSTCTHMKAHKMLLPLFNLLYTHGLACSKLAGNWLFGKKEFFVLPNGFITEKFKFNKESRREIREKLNLSDKLVIGHVGRFNNQKNHEFLLKVFENIADKNPNARLLLIGDGPDFDKINEIINQHKYKDNIIVYGESSETENLYAAMDIFVFPSKFEGLGIVALEAQINGLPCVMSEAVPKDVIITENTLFLPIGEENTDRWAEILLNTEIKSDEERYRCYEKNLKDINKFDIRENAKYLEKLYERFLKK